MDVKDKLVTLEELGTAVDHMSDELEDAVAQTIASRDIESLFTNRDSHFAQGKCGLHFLLPQGRHHRWDAAVFH